MLYFVIISFFLYLMTSLNTELIEISTLGNLYVGFRMVLTPFHIPWNTKSLEARYRAIKNYRNTYLK